MRMGEIMILSKAEFNICYDNVKASGYVLGELKEVVKNDKVIGYNFKPVDVIIEKMFSKGKIDFKKLERIAFEECKIKLD